MNRVWHLAVHDTRLFIRGRENFFFMLVMPVLFMLFFSVVFTGGGGDQVQVSLQVVDRDGEFLAEAFATQLRAENFDVVAVAPAEADTTDYIRRIVIPAGFTRQLLSGEPVDLGFSKISESSLEFDMAADVRLRQAQAAFLGALMRWDRKPAAGVEPGEITSAERDRLTALLQEPRRVSVTQRHAGRGRPVPAGASQSIPGMLTMFVVMTVMIGGAASLAAEKHSGTLARLAATPFSRAEILGGKLLHLALVGTIQAIVLMAAGEAIGRSHLFGIDFTWGSGFWLVGILIVPYAICVACLTLFVGGLFRTTQQAESLGWLVGMVISALGGCWWPLEIMPRAARALARFFPTSWAMEGFHGVVTFGRGLEAIALPAVVLLGMALVLGWLGSRTMKVTT